MTRSRRLWLGGVAVAAVAFAALWSARRPIADDAIRQEFTRRGVPASYVISDIGFRTQRLENIRIGDPARPDLIVDWAEVDLAPGWSGVRITAVRASGVRLRGRLVDGRPRWGTVDKLLPAPSSAPFALPGIHATLRDAVVALVTPYGAVGLRLDGTGRLDNGFRGRALVVSSKLAQGGCRANRARGLFEITVRDSLPALKGPVKIDRVDCAAGGAEGIAGTVHVDFGRDVSTAELSMTAIGGRYDGHRFAKLAFEGRGGGTGDAQSFGGTLRVGQAIPDPQWLATARRTLASPNGSPAAALSRRLAEAVNGLRTGGVTEADLVVGHHDGNVGFVVERLDMTARSGARLNLAYPSSPVGIDGQPTARTFTARLSGGGFPDAKIDLSGDAARGWRGQANVAPLMAGAERLTFSPVVIDARANGALSLKAGVQFDGPVGDGRVEGLTAALAVTRTPGGAFGIAAGCLPVGFRRLTLGGARFDAFSTRVCPAGGATVLDGATTGRVRLTGRSGSAPLLITARSLGLSGRDAIDARMLSAVVGQGAEVTRLDVARIEGSLESRSGRFAGLSGRIAKVPLAATDGAGTWAWAGGALTAGGGLRVSDQAESPRFLPMAVDSARLALKDGAIAATGTLREPDTRRKVADVAIEHRLSGSTGEARLTVAELTFGKTLQPEMLAPATKGIVADVQGQIDGTGTIRWTGDRVTSEGRFRSDGLDFAAVLGPVTGVSGEIVFDDLLALSTPSGQRVRVAGINPGVEVTGGEIAYRLRPNQVVEIEGGRWPFAGGELALDPAVLDFGEDRPRRMVFRLTALDAGKFIERLQLDNIAATGTFDGTLPIVFDTSGGQVVGGRLVARGPGTLAYVGDVSNAQTNVMTRLAFDALKSIRYRNLAIELDGSLDGEIVSRVLFSGTNQAAVAPTGIARSFTGLPFKFNIVVRAPFRGLVNTARTFQDPALLIQPPVSGARP